MTRPVFLFLLCGLLSLVLGLRHTDARGYFVSSTGSDADPGSRSKPWRSVARVNATDFGCGDHVHFEGGRRFHGTIQLDADDSGAVDGKLVITSYGCARAVIDGMNGSGLTAHGCSHLAIRNLDFVGSGRKGENTKDGVSVLDAQALEIERVDVSGFRGSGLSLDGIRDARITKVYAHENGAAGISVGYHRR